MMINDELVWKMFYIIIIFGAALCIAAANFLADGIYTFYAFGTMLLYVFMGVFCIVIFDGALAFIVRCLPERWFSPEARCFTVSKCERKLYRHLRINAWKKHVPELGGFTGFHKDQLRHPEDSTYVGRFLLESHYGVVGHIAGACFGFLILFLPFLRTFTVAFPIAIVNFILNLMPTMILRYNTPTLLRLYRRNIRRDKNKEDAMSHT